MRIGQTVLIHFLSKGIGSVLGFVATVYFARILGNVVIGQYSLIMAVVAWLGIFKSLGVSYAITKRISEGEEPHEYFFAGVVLMTIATAIGVTVILFTSEFINSYVGVEAVHFVILLLIIKVSWSLTKSGLKGSHLVHVYSVADMGGKGVQSLVQIGLVVVGFGLAGMVYGYMIGVALASIVGIWYLKPKIRLPRRSHFVSLFDYAKYSWMGGIQSKTYSWVDVTVLGFFVSTGLVGVYTVAWSIGTFLNTFASSVTASLFPEISKESTENNITYVSKQVEESLSYAGLIMIPGVVGGALLGDRILLIYGPGFVVGETVLTILLVALLLYSYMKQLKMALNAIDRPDLAFRVNAVFIVTNFSLNVILVYSIGWVGAAIATAISTGTGLLISMYYTRQQIPLSMPVTVVSSQFSAAICMGAVVYIGMWVESAYLDIGQNTIETVLLVTVGAVTYFAILYTISSPFKETVQNNLPQIISDLNTN